MIFPKKHLKIHESLLAMGAVILILLSEPLDLEDLWRKIQTPSIIKKLSYYTFDKVVLALVFLRMLNLIDIDDKGRIKKCD